ncbi:MAG: YihY/virulence factor BrkB family protein [Lachnospiraceae bacterium]|nr:YihY/virulence factor BrkB family protein [Lachnospiraceae bacterium]MCM1278739.1 YihY/virulence factor BrkB family protein [Robinsoniella sp.]
MWKKLYILSKEFAKQINDNHIGAYASSAAFFMFLSLIPILLLLCSIIPYTPITKATLMNALVDFMPDSIDPIAVSVVNEVYGKSTTLLSVTAIAAIWAGARGIWALNRGLNVINDVETKGYFALKFRSCIYTIILICSIMMSLTITVYGDTVVAFIRTSIPQSRYLMDFLSSLKLFIVSFLLFIFLMFLFTWLPNERQKWYTQIPGAVFSSLVWVVYSWGFSIYLEYFGGYTMYGSLATIIILMLWLYMCMYIVLMGAMLNKFLMPANLFIWKKRRGRSST